MADPLSIASGITAVLTVAVQLVSVCYQYSSTVKGATADIQKMLHELTSLMGVLTSIKAIIDPECQEPWADDENKLVKNSEIGERLTHHCSLTRSQIDLLKMPLDDCKQALDEVKVKLIGASTSSKLKLSRTSQLLMWPLKQKETLALLRRLERHKATFLSALTAQNFVVGLQVRNAIGDIIESQERIERRLDKPEVQASGVYQWLSPVDYMGAHRAARQLRLKDTGTWMLESHVWHIWLENERSFLWLYGIPGSGKTVLISTLLEYCMSREQGQGKAVVYYYCDFREKKSQRSENVLGAIICQLSKQLEDTPGELLEFFNSHRTDNEEYSTPTYRELEDLFMSLLIHYPSIIIVLDALDECLNRESLLLFLNSLIVYDACKIKVLVSSRQEGDIQAAFAKHPQQSTNVYAVDEDIRSYIDDSIRKSNRLSRLSPDLMDLVKDSLHTGANGMFQWVQCQIEDLSGLRTDRDIRRAINYLPRSLEDTYERILSRIREADSVVARRALMWLAFSARPLKLVELAEAVIVDLGTTSLDVEARWDPLDLLSVIGSLVIYSKDGNITLAHNSIKDYLLSGSLMDKIPHFSLTEAMSNTEIAGICLTYLLMEDFSSGVSYQEGKSQSSIVKHTAPWIRFKQKCRDCPLLTYASQYWPSHAQRYLQYSPPLVHLACTLMDPQRTPKFWSWLECLIAQGRCGLRNLPDTLTPLYFAASFGLVEVVEKLLDLGVDVSARGGMFDGTALHAAIYRKHPSVVAKLLEGGASITTVDANGFTPDQLNHDNLEIWNQIQEWSSSMKKKAPRRKEGTLLDLVTSMGYFKGMRGNTEP